MERLLRKVVLRKGVIEIMKKAYVKPELYFENFELSASIAYSCGMPTLTPTNGTCGVFIAGVGNVFLTGVAGCKYTGANGKNYEDGDFGICYHLPDSSQNLFNSQ